MRKLTFNTRYFVSTSREEVDATRHLQVRDLCIPLLVVSLAKTRLSRNATCRSQRRIQEMRYDAEIHEIAYQAMHNIRRGRKCCFEITRATTSQCKLQTALLHMENLSPPIRRPSQYHISLAGYSLVPLISHHTDLDLKPILP